MSVWSAIGSWAVNQFANNFLGGKKNGGGDIWGRVIEAGATTLGDKLFDTGKPNKRYGPVDVDLGVTAAKTYSMSDARAPDTPEGVDYATIEAKWTRIAKKLGDIQDTTAITR